MSDDELDETKIQELLKTFPAFFSRFDYVDTAVLATVLSEFDFDADDATEHMVKMSSSGSGSRQEPVKESAPKKSSSLSRKRAAELEDEVDEESTQNNVDSTVKTSGRFTRSSGRSDKSKVESSLPRPPPKKPRDLVFKYTPKEDEMLEDDNLEILNEDRSDLLEFDIPCRNLDNFVIYDENNKNKLVSMMDYMKEKCSIVASGDVTAQGADYEELVDEDDDEELDGGESDEFNDSSDPKPVRRFGQRVKLSSIFFAQDDEEMIESGSPRIWLRTTYAFYRLLRPAKEYEPYFKKIFIMFRAKSAIIANVMQNDSITWEEFLKVMNNDLTVAYNDGSGNGEFGGGSSSSASSSSAVESGSQRVGSSSKVPTYQCDLTEKDIRANIISIADEVQEFMEQHQWLVYHNPLIQTIIQMRDSKGRAKGDYQVKKNRAQGRGGDKVRDVNKFVLEKRTMSTITPLVAKIAAGLFKRNVIKVDAAKGDVENSVDPNSADPKPENSEPVNTTATKVKLRHTSSKVVQSILLLEPVIGTRKINNTKTRNYHDSCMIDGDLLSIGDCVYVRKPKEEADPQEPWFFKICYFFEEVKKTVDGEGTKSKKYVHARWLCHGKESILEEVASYNELFLTDDCMDLPIKAIVKKCDVVNLEVGEPEPDYGDEERFFYRMFYDKDQGFFEEADRHEDVPESNSALNSILVSNSQNIPTTNYCAKHEWCGSCNRKKFFERQVVPTWALFNEEPSWTLEKRDDLYCSFEYNGELYTKGDFVYIVPTTANDPYVIGQIESIDDKYTNKNGNAKNRGLDSWLQNGHQSASDYDDDDESNGNSENKKRKASKRNPSEKGSNIWVNIRVFKRHVELLKELDRLERMNKGIQDPLSVPSFTHRDDRRLLVTNERMSIEATKLEGICWVRHRSQIIGDAAEGGDEEAMLNRYKDDDYDNFWYDQILVGTGKPGTKVRYDVRTIVKAGDIEEADPEKYIEMGYLKGSPMREEHREKQVNEKREFLANVEKVKALDIFSGCGGLTCGMEMSGVVETTNAVEFSASAAVTFRHNFPGSTVHNYDANTLLARAIDPSNKKPLLDFAGEKLIDLPSAESHLKPHFIYGGPPCQGYSGINRFKKADDVKNSLVATHISYVDFYRPDYFLLENVRGLVTFKLGGEQAGTNRISGGIQMGVVKFIIRALLSMDYQVRFGILQAGQHGLPQSRRRFFVWGAKRPLTLPLLPQPTHCFNNNSALTISLPSVQLKNNTSLRTPGHAPHPPITVWDAISDLPGFEYADPEFVCPGTTEDDEEIIEIEVTQSQADLEEANYEGENDSECEDDDDEQQENNNVKKRRKGANGTKSKVKKLIKKRNGRMTKLVKIKKARNQVINTLNGPLSYKVIEVNPKKSKIVGKLVQDYPSPPMTEFQRRIRSHMSFLKGNGGNGNKEVLYGHVTRAFDKLNTERIVRVAMVPGADHHSLPKPLSPWCLSHKDSAASKHGGWKGLFGRLDYNGHFLTALTDIQPMGKQGTVIHPVQKRVLSLRECARAQGFPDEFHFTSYNPNDPDAAEPNIKDLHRQVGNAVPPPLAKAMGLCLLDALLVDERNGRGRKKKNGKATEVDQDPLMEKNGSDVNVEAKGDKGKGKMVITEEVNVEINAARKENRAKSNGIKFYN
ncbi:hypothetical protein HK098_007368 [Nowakowskiella sp. JEL0407]|nr:hypothetical protein HK098_007368 [Nowakowskiella sp. JEL0407]